MGEILFICHRIPFPPDRGDKIRSHHILKRLAQLAPVHVATFADDDYDAHEEAELAATARSYKLVRRGKSLIMAGLQAVSSGKPVSLPAFHDRVLAAYIKQVIAERPVSVIYVFSGQMGQYVPDSYAGRVVIDFVDVDSAKFDAYGEKESGPIGWVNAREGHKLRAEEARLAQRADASLLITRDEADLFSSRLPDGIRGEVDVRVLGNGIDSNHFDPILVGPEPRMMDCNAPRLIFTGQMDYAPNVEAAQRVIHKILPLIRETIPDATFHVVGRNPASELLDHHGQHGVFVWGRVDDPRTWLKAADMAIVPLDIARGVQNKVLEAMAMTLPVVLTPAAATGIGAKDGKHFLIGATDAELAAAVVSLFSDTRRAQIISQSARRYVVAHVSWQAALEPLPELIGKNRPVISDAA